MKNLHIVLIVIGIILLIYGMYLWNQKTYNGLSHLKTISFLLVIAVGVVTFLVNRADEKEQDNKDSQIKTLSEDNLKLTRENIELTKKTNKIVKTESGNTRSLVSEEANKTREQVKDSSNNNLVLLKNHMTEQLKPAINNVVNVWSDYIYNQHTIKEFAGRLGPQILKENTSLNNQLRTNVNKLRSEITITKSIIEDLISGGGYEPVQFSEVIKYIFELPKPYNNVANDFINKEKTKEDSNEIWNKRYKEMFVLEKKFSKVYKNVLKLN